jgi:hypothetical protein
MSVGRSGSGVALTLSGSEGVFLAGAVVVVVGIPDPATVTCLSANVAGPSPIWLVAATVQRYSWSSRKPVTVTGDDVTSNAVALRFVGVPVAVVIGDVHRAEKWVAGGAPLSAGGRKLISTRPSSEPAPSCAGSALALTARGGPGLPGTNAGFANAAWPRPTWLIATTLQV